MGAVNGTLCRRVRPGRSLPDPMLSVMSNLDFQTLGRPHNTVKLPRARRPASYAAQLVIRCFCLGM
jgi:hypothetical protein